MLSLEVQPSVLSGLGANYDISNLIYGWSRSTRLIGGPWLGEFTIMPERPVDRGMLEHFFYNWLGQDFHEKFSGYRSWRGMIYEMDLTINGITRRRSFDTMVNYATVRYTDTNNETQQISGSGNSVSEGKYGRRAMVYQLRTVTSTVATAYRDKKLLENAWPYPTTVGVLENRDELSLKVSVAGYWLTLPWRYAGYVTNADINISTWIQNLVSTSAEFVQGIVVDSNTMQVRSELREPIRLDELILDLLDLGDSSQNTYFAHVDNERNFKYRVLSNEPIYEIINGRVLTTGGAQTEPAPWLVVPGVMRDSSFPMRAGEYNHWLQKAEDFVVTEVSCGTGNGLVLKTDQFAESDVLTAQLEYEAQRESNTETTTTETTTGHETIHKWWKIFGMTRAEWYSLSKQERRRLKLEWERGKYRKRKRR